MSVLSSCNDLDRPGEVAHVGNGELPVVVIRPQQGWPLPDLREVWEYHQLLYFLIWRDVKVRYKQTVIGIAWAILQPVMTTIVFTVFLGRLAAAPSTGVAYPLFVFTGMLPWGFFAAAVGSAGQSVVGNERLIAKVFFPRIIIPLAAVGAALFDLMVASTVLLAMMAYYGVVPTLGIVFVPLIVAILLVLAVGVGSLLAALNVAYRDFRYVVPFFLQLWMFATPAIYTQTSSLTGGVLGAILPLNPAQGLIRNFRSAVLGGPIDVYSLAVSSAVAVTAAFVGMFYYKRTERRFSDII